MDEFRCLEKSEHFLPHMWHPSRKLETRPMSHCVNKPSSICAKWIGEIMWSEMKCSRKSENFLPHMWHPSRFGSWMWYGLQCLSGKLIRYLVNIHAQYIFHDWMYISHFANCQVYNKCYQLYSFTMSVIVVSRWGRIYTIHKIWQNCEACLLGSLYSRLILPSMMIFDISYLPYLKPRTHSIQKPI